MTTDPGPANRLADEISPYLQQHKTNPVHWLPWGDAAFALAQRDNKPVLLSVGYAACHWCHVMAAESFENPVIADVMNRHFVNVKVDREERPDIDQIYQTALALLAQHGGWPLTMFLTPDGAPFWGGTYFPATPRYGRPGFVDVLTAIAATWHQERDKVDRNVAALSDALRRVTETASAEPLPDRVVDRAAERLVREVDPFFGGLGQAPKFPQASAFELLWRAWLRSGREPFRTAVMTTLVKICQGGIYDHLGGGFARYSTDDEWLVPHFEKMLYDNAQLIDLLTLVWQGTGEPLFARRVEETIAWLDREMTLVDGGFASAIDADSEHQEGRFYVWTADEIAEVLGPDAAMFCDAYDVTPNGNWDGVSILNRRRSTTLAAPEVEARLARLCGRLLSHRRTRVAPLRDDKVLADWNGLMITALVHAGLVFDRPAWIAAARRAFSFVTTVMTTTDGRLRHAWRNGETRADGMLDDYATMARAALALRELDGDQALLALAERFVQVLDDRFWDTDRGGYFQTADDGDCLIVRMRSAHDQSTPSGNGMMLDVLTRLAAITGRTHYRDRADALVAALSGEMVRMPAVIGRLLNSLSTLDSMIEIVIVGVPDDPATQMILRTIAALSLPERLIQPVVPGATLPDGHPAVGKSALDGRPTVYLCHRQTCTPPITEPEQLRNRLLALSPRAAPNF